MSAYVVSKETIDRIVTFCDSKGAEHFWSYYPEIHKVFAGDCNKLGQKMLVMNNKAVDARYSENNPIEIYRFSLVCTSIMQVYKSLQCFLYQCSEGDIPKSGLYQDLKKLEHDIAHDIISSTTEYGMAQWG